MLRTSANPLEGFALISYRFLLNVDDAHHVLFLSLSLSLFLDLFLDLFLAHDPDDLFLDLDLSAHVTFHDDDDLALYLGPDHDLVRDHLLVTADR